MYDDSLSYYEVLCKVTETLNQVVNVVNEIPDTIREIINEGSVVRDAVDEYLNNPEVINTAVKKAVDESTIVYDKVESIVNNTDIVENKTQEVIEETDIVLNKVDSVINELYPELVANAEFIRQFPLEKQGTNSVVLKNNGNSSAGSGSAVIGTSCQTTNNNSFSGGYNCRAINAPSTFSYGENCEANQWGASSMGKDSTSSARFSHTRGLGVTSNREGQMVVGKYNNPDASKMFIVGGGSSDTNRKNLFSVGDNGCYAGNAKILSLGEETQVDRITESGLYLLRAVYGNTGSSYYNSIVWRIPNNYQLIYEHTSILDGAVLHNTTLYIDADGSLHRSLARIGEEGSIDLTYDTQFYVRKIV